MPLRADVETWFNSLPLRTELNTEEERSLWELIGHPGFGALWGLQLAARQGMYLQLANAQLHDPAQVNRAAVLQGTIKGIELLFDTLLELATPAQADAAAEGART